MLQQIKNHPNVTLSEEYYVCINSWDMCCEAHARTMTGDVHGRVIYLLIPRC